MKQYLAPADARNVQRAPRRSPARAEPDRFQSALIATISHDLKTPLTTISGAAQVLRDCPNGLSSSARADLLTDIVAEVDRLNRYVDSLLDLAKLQSGMTTAHLSLHRLDDVVACALQRAEKMLAHHNVEVSVSAGLPMVEIDAPLFEQVLFNLLDNAGKYSPQGTTIRILAWRDRHAVCLQVLDQGKGVPPAALEAIFDRFHRVDRSDQAPPGAGLGLAICRGFIEAMRGTITAANRTERNGAIFTIRLDLVCEPAKLVVTHERMS
jgi:two-component system sensor histidine kinase KdpD